MNKCDLVAYNIYALLKAVEKMYHGESIQEYKGQSNINMDKNISHGTKTTAHDSLNASPSTSTKLENSPQIAQQHMLPLLTKDAVKQQSTLLRLAQILLHESEDKMPGERDAISNMIADKEQELMETRQKIL